MRLNLLGAIALGVAALPAYAGNITDKQAQELPVPDLAQLALGEAGKLMMDVKRPRDGSLKWDTLRFYSRAVVTGSQFGMCGSDWVTLHFDDKGVLESISAQRRYGVEGPLYKKGSDWTYEESGRICSAVKNTRRYFPAPGAQESLDIARYVDAIAGRGPFAKQDFTFQCTGICGRERLLLNELQLNDIDQARIVDCEETTLTRPSCFELVVGENTVGPFPKKFRVYGTTYMNHVVISAVKVDVGSTLE